MNSNCANHGNIVLGAPRQPPRIPEESVVHDQVDYSGCGEHEALSYYVRRRGKGRFPDEGGERERDATAKDAEDGIPHHFPRDHPPPRISRFDDEPTRRLSLRLVLEIIFLFVFSLFLRYPPPRLRARRADTMKTLNRHPYLLSLQLFRTLIFSTTSAPSPPFSQSLSPRSASLHAINTEDRSIGHGATTVQQVFSRYTAFSSLAYPFVSSRLPSNVAAYHISV